MAGAAPPLSLPGIVASLRVPTPRDVIYAVKAFVAAALGLAAGFWLNLENPYWAALTVYIVVNPPGAGAVRVKCIFRLVGTLVGGLGVLALTSLFGDQIGVLLTAVIALIVAAMFLNQIDKTPTNYIWLAVAVTGAVIALSNLSHPERIFELTVARVGEISLGILATAAVDCFWAESMTPAFAKSMAGWCGKAREFLVETITLSEPPGSDKERKGKLEELIKGVQAIDAKAVQLPFDTVPRPPRLRDLDLLRRQVVETVGGLVAVELRAQPLREPGALPIPLDGRLEAVIAWMRDEDDLPADELDGHLDRGRVLAGQLEAVRDGFDETPGRTALMERGLVTRLAAFLHDWCDLRIALRAVETGSRLPDRLEAVATRAKPVRSIDYLETTLNLVPLVLAMTVSSIIWYLTAWQNGPTALLFSWGACIFLLGQGQVLNSMAGFLTCILTAFALVFLYQFVLLPRVTDFTVLILVLGCALIPLGLLMSMSMAGMLIAALSFSFLALQNVYMADFAQTVQTLVALLIGALVAVISLRVCSYDRAAFAAHRLAAAIRGDVLDVARARRSPDRDRFRFLALYRLALYFPAAEQAAGGGRPDSGPLSDLSLGHNLLKLRRRGEGVVSERTRDLVGSLRTAVATLVQDRGGAWRGEDAERARDLVHAAMDDPAIRAEPARHALLDALTGLDLALSGLPRRSLEATAP